MTSCAFVIGSRPFFEEQLPRLLAVEPELQIIQFPETPCGTVIESVDHIIIDPTWRAHFASELRQRMLTDWIYTYVLTRMQSHNAEEITAKLRDEGLL